MIPMIHSSACMLIDAIKPVGTLNHRAYQFMSQINALHDPFERFLGGEMLADVAIYYDKNSMYDPDAEGLTAGQATKNIWNRPPHLEAAVGAARFLREAHVPFGVITNISLDQIGKYRAVVLPSVVEMTPEEAGVFREFVRSGGILYASGTSSLSAPGDGEERFLLEDVLGVHYLGKLGDGTTYLSTTDQELTDAIWPQENMGFSVSMVQVEAHPAAQVLATVTLPFVDPDLGNPINTRFAQIWSNPPAPQPGKDPGIVVNSFGKGKTIWIAAPLELRADQVNARIFHLLLRRALLPPYKFEADADPAVEVTLFHQEDRRRLLVGMLNLQMQVPTIPVPATLRIQVPAGSTVRGVSLLPGEKALPFAHVGSYVTFKVPSFSLVSMAMVDYV